MSPDVGNVLGDLKTGNSIEGIVLGAGCVVLEGQTVPVQIFARVEKTRSRRVSRWAAWIGYALRTVCTSESGRLDSRY